MGSRESKEKLKKRCKTYFNKIYEGEEELEYGLLEGLNNRVKIDGKLVVPLVPSDYFNDKLGDLLDQEQFLKRVSKGKSEVRFCFLHGDKPEFLESLVSSIGDLPGISDFQFCRDALVGIEDIDYYFMVGMDVDLFMGTERHFEELFGWKIKDYLEEYIEKYFEIPFKEYPDSPIGISLQKLRARLNNKK